MEKINGIEVCQELPNPVVVYDRNNNVIFVNNAFEDLTKYTKTDVLGTTLPCLWWPSQHTHEMLQKYKEAMDRGEMIGRNLHFYAKNGNDIYVDERMTRANGYFISNWTDVTQETLEQKLIETKLRKAGAILDHLILHQAAINDQLAA